MPHFQTADGQKLYYESLGEGDQTVIMIHGSFMNGRVWDHQALSLADSYRMVRIDLRGHGRSDKPASGYSYPRYGKDVEELIEHLNLDSVIVIGWSMGALVAVEYVEENTDRTEKLGLVSTGMFHRVSDNEQREQEYIPYEEFMQEIRTKRPEAMRWFVDMMTGERIDETTKRWLWDLEMESAIQANVGTMEAAAEMETSKIKSILDSIDMPVGIFHGGLDKAATIEDAQYVSDQLVSEGALYQYDESRHVPFLSQPDKFDSDIREFLGEST